jgi:hypothetical protein
MTIRHIAFFASPSFFLKNPKYFQTFDLLPEYGNVFCIAICLLFKSESNAVEVTSHGLCHFCFTSDDNDKPYEVILLFTSFYFFFKYIDYDNRIPCQETYSNWLLIVGDNRPINI